VNCIAHRGFAGRFPENTPTAVRRAVAAGADGIEVDVRRCGSGEIVVVHDERVDRVTDRSGAVRDLSRSALADCSVLGTGEGVPTLERVCELVPGSVRLHLELKETGIAADALAVAERHDFDLLVSSFEVQALREAASASGSVQRALLCPVGDGEAIATARDLGCAAINPHWESCDDASVARAHEAGLAVNAWTVTSQDAADRLGAIRADGLITDFPACCRPGSSQ
jgi:glycerophosphoryl diester phosphodiesterase